MKTFYIPEHLPRRYRRSVSARTGSRVFVSYEEELVAYTMTELGWEWEYEVYEFIFSNGEKLRSLKPDFLVRTPQGSVFFIEVKSSPDRRGNGKGGRRHKRPRTMARRAGIDLAVLYCPKKGPRRLKRRLKRALLYAQKAGRRARRRGADYFGWRVIRVQKKRNILFVPVLRVAV